jgi:hypothetical protein
MDILREIRYKIIKVSKESDANKSFYIFVLFYRYPTTAGLCVLLLMMMSFICSFRNNNETKAIYPFFITVVPNTKLCAWGEEDRGEHVCSLLQYLS